MDQTSYRLLALRTSGTGAPTLRTTVWQLALRENDLALND